MQTKQLLTMIVALSGMAAYGGDTARVLQIRNESGIRLSIGGLTAFDNGQLIGAYFQQAPLPARPWLSRIYGQVRLKADVNDHFSILLSPEVKLWFDTYSWHLLGNEAFSKPFTQRSTVSFADAEGVLRFGDSSRASILCAAGVIPYKYNSDAKNLGEYLFRSGVHPAFVWTGFDYAFARLTGVRVSGKFIRDLSVDGFLTTETQFLPTRDWSLSLLANYDAWSIATVGAGAMFYRLFPVDNSATEPEAQVADGNKYLASDGAEAYYSFAGTKLMGRLSLDPKGLLPSGVRHIFGREDFRIYGEIAVLGTEDITAYKHPLDSVGGLDTTVLVMDTAQSPYSDITQRIPVMFGFTIPTFRILDYLSIEFEWYGWPYSSSCYRSGFSIPLPMPGKAQSVDPEIYRQDDWKFSINAKATVYRHFSILGQIARDHTRHEVFDPARLAANVDEEALMGDDSWGWWLKLQYAF